ncbi:2-succinyl-6-hydroxy-2,4-cyclohexadiene-1-carboxylate synthase [Weissella uvarum]|uniref:2-succinyl-6-hydroxy-2, 4-cyclohexadiene-1-carboxylate synthase n=1 Tax=Weissella uvarum TaxID=1479233 RepID=UPI00195FE691|nr:2-succinyl-6-hydroxy-2,4-cyclohexadiene-1-carboxylate synthase [Weissella uvarum]MBM7616531.1 2-succinyl-6-hydroxy-2,4-cyclohexadiene-1-carboxylate synthase [Weissella uvarum]MCM0595008.1 2-succinyl-6-hydroxy-2,4-cyclohexadiene-1-carboxylate synthase [Weissella uvarum]
MPTIEVRGYPYHYEQKGTGTPTWLFLHGFMGSHADFEAINPRGTAIYLDLLGFGPNAPVVKDSHRFQAEQQIADLQTLIQNLTQQPVQLVGYSMGARLALAYALAHPEDIQLLVLESGTPGLADADERQARQLADEKKAHRVLESGMEAFINEWEQLPMFASQQQLPATQRAFMHAQRVAQQPENVAASLREFGTGAMPNLWPQLRALDVATVLINGALDKKFLCITQNMLLHLPQAHDVQIPEAGHNVHFEAPMMFTQVLNDMQAMLYK